MDIEAVEACIHFLHVMMMVWCDHSENLPIGTESISDHWTYQVGFPTLVHASFAQHSNST